MRPRGLRRPQPRRHRPRQRPRSWPWRRRPRRRRRQRIRPPGLRPRRPRVPSRAESCLPSGRRLPSSPYRRRRRRLRPSRRPRRWWPKLPRALRPPAGLPWRWCRLRVSRSSNRRPRRLFRPALPRFRSPRGRLLPRLRRATLPWLPHLQRPSLRRPRLLFRPMVPRFRLRLLWRLLLLRPSKLPQFRRRSCLQRFRKGRGPRRLRHNRRPRSSPNRWWQSQPAPPR